MLTLNPPGAHHSFKLFWDGEWNLIFWYVNLEEPFQRLRRGIIHRDLFLDIVVTPSLTWSWKDEDEFEVICAAGALPREACRRVREEAQRMIARIEARKWPFNMAWPDWRPDPAWPAPSIPGEWRPHRSMRR